MRVEGSCKIQVARDGESQAMAIQICSGRLLTRYRYIGASGTSSARHLRCLMAVKASKSHPQGYKAKLTQRNICLSQSIV